MNGAVVGESSGRVELVGELGAAIEHAGVPETRGITRRARGRAMKTGIPIPLNRIADFDSNRCGRKIIAARPDTHVESFRVREMDEEKRKRPSEDGEPGG